MNLNRATSISYFLLRAVTGWMYFQAGATKLAGWFGGMPGSGGVPAPLMTQVGIGGALEFFGGIAIMLGLFTRPVAFILCGEMAVAYWQFHAPNGAWPVQNGGVAAALFCFVFLYMAARGAGEWSLDSLIARRGSKKS
ncbi:MAG: DoxX family protein [Candidatus Eisenbacteria bacterium]|uniref:DoxX family protein n=1 Tax=Eiseniibacteriota bacterium TaxID=2212470 RepID=A0A849SHB1_UNCEI|nr:DoxX family protein [Candidatus Eisenbacteria bacterium]